MISILTRSLSLAGSLATVLACSAAPDQAATSAYALSGSSDSFPAFPSDLPQLSVNSGHVMRSPRIITVTWDADPNAAS